MCSASSPTPAFPLSLISLIAVQVDALKADIDKARGMADKYHSDGLSASELLQSLETQFRADKATHACTNLG